MRVFFAVLLVAVAYPGFAALYGVLHGPAAGGALAWSSQHLPLVWAGAGVVVFGTLLVLERPRAPSPQAYLVQLRDRFRRVQGEFERAVEAALRDRKVMEFDAAGPGGSGAASDRLDGLDAAENTRR